MEFTIGSKNQAKVNAVENICSSLLENVDFLFLYVPSNVSDQPFGDEETLHGAKNRLWLAIKESQAEYCFRTRGWSQKTINGTTAYL